MPYLPTTWKERHDADSQRKVEGMLNDQRFPWLRTRTARRVLVVASGLLAVALIPAFEEGGTLIGTAILVATWACWLVLRVSVRTVADLPDRFLDERQRAQRDRAYLGAFRIYSFVVGALATVGLIAFIFAAENEQLTITTTWSQAFSLAIFVITIPILLPSMVLAWRDASEVRD